MGCGGSSLGSRALPKTFDKYQRVEFKFSEAGGCNTQFQIDSCHPSSSPLSRRLRLLTSAGCGFQQPSVTALVQVYHRLRASGSVSCVLPREDHQRTIIRSTCTASRHIPTENLRRYSQAPSSPGLITHPAYRLRHMYPTFFASASALGVQKKRCGKRLDHKRQR